MFDIFNKKKVKELETKNRELFFEVSNLRSKFIEQELEKDKYEALCDGICGTCVHGIHISAEDYKKLSEKCNCTYRGIDGEKWNLSTEADRVICGLKAGQFCKNYIRRD